METSASEKVSQVNPEFNEVRVNKKMLISYYVYYSYPKTKSRNIRTWEKHSQNSNCLPKSLMLGALIIGGNAESPWPA